MAKPQNFWRRECVKRVTLTHAEERKKRLTLNIFPLSL
jgi:hypothetical protein